MRLISIGVATIVAILVFAFAACGEGGGGPGDGGVSGTISGRVTYDFVPSVYKPSTGYGTLDFNNAQERPVRNAIVKLRQGLTVLKTTQTDGGGNYSFDLSPLPSGPLTVVALAETTTPPILVQNNTNRNAEWAIYADFTGGGTHNLHATHGWTGTRYDPNKRSAAPFAILDSMYTASQAYLAVRPSANFPLLKVNWSPDNVSDTYFDSDAGADGGAGEIYILGKEDVDTDEFDNHVIVHEWGHFFEHNLSRSDTPGARHVLGAVLDPRLAFSEGYGDAMSGILLNDPIYSDLIGDESSPLVGVGFDLSAPPPNTDDPDAGTMSEMSVARALYQLRTVGLGTIYDTLVGPEKTTDALTTIGSFVTGLKAQPGVDAGTVDSALAAHGMGPICTQWGDDDTNRTWSLRKMYVDVPTALPVSQSFTFDASKESNKREQNQYYVVQGNGGQITATASSAGNIALQVYRTGNKVTEADAYGDGGTETAHFSTQSGAKYVVVLYGHKDKSRSTPTPTPAQVCIGAGATANCQATCTANNIQGWTANDHQDCYNGDVYWYDSCGVRGALAADCTGTQVCVDTGATASCQAACTADDHQDCYNGDVYWFDSCGTRGALAADCTGTQVCVDTGATASCQVACTANDHQDCYNGDVYWYDSCGARGALAADCTGTQVCVDAGATASCQAACTANDYQYCYSGDVYWFDSCGNVGALASSCGGCGCSGSACLSCSSYHITSDPPLNTFTPDFTPSVSCTCSSVNCEAMDTCGANWRGRVTSIDQTNHTTTLEFAMAANAVIPATMTAWVAAGAVQNPSCTQMGCTGVRWSSTTQGGALRWTTPPLDLSWLAGQPCGATDVLYLITGSPSSPTTKVWFQKQAIVFTKVCP